MNTEPASRGSDFGSVLAPSSGTSQASDAIAVLEKRIEREQDQRKEERYFWIFAVVLLVAGYVTPNLSWSLIPLTLLAVVFLIALAEWLGVQWVVVPLRTVLAHLMRDKGQKPTKSGSKRRSPSGNPEDNP